MAAVADVADQLDQMVHCSVDTSVRGALLDMDPHRFAQAVQCNGSALLPLVQAALPLFRRGGSVIFVTSRGSQVAVSGYGAVGRPKMLGEALVTAGLSEFQTEILSVVRTFVDKEIIPNATALEHADEFPDAIVAGMKDMGMFGLTISDSTAASSLWRT